MSISQKNFYAIFLGILAILISAYIVPLYVNGDQIAYKGFFDNCILHNNSITDKWICYTSYLGSKEPGYFLIMNFIGSIFDRVFINICANFLILFFLTKIIFEKIKNGIERFSILFLLISNFYILVLFFSAERLKFAFLFFLIFIICKKIYKYVFILFSLLTHTQMIIIFLSLYINYIYNSKISLIRKILINIFTFTFLLIFFILGRDHIVSKFDAYSTIVQESDSGFFSLLKVSILYFFTLFSYPRLSIVLAGFPILVSSYFLGSTRIMMIMFLFYFFTIVLYKKKTDVFFYLMMLYFSLKSINFISKIILYGDGFYIV